MLFLISKWRDIKIPTRHKIAEAFGFKKVRSTHVSNNEVVDDGFNLKDIESALILENLQKFVHSTETDLNVLFDKTVDKVEGRTPKVEEVKPSPIQTPMKVINHAKTKTRKQK